MQQPQDNTHDKVDLATQLFDVLVLQGSPDAIDIFFRELDDNLYYFRAHGEDRQKLLTQLESIDPNKLRPHERVRILHAVGKGKMFLGDTEGAVRSLELGYESATAITQEAAFEPFKMRLGQGEQAEVTLTKPSDTAIMVLLELVHAQRLSGRLKDAEQTARLALSLTQSEAEKATAADTIMLYRAASAVALYRLGMVLSARGETSQAEDFFRKSLMFWEAARIWHFCGFVAACLAQQAVWMEDFKSAAEWMQKAGTWFDKDQDPRSINVMTSHRLLGTIAMEQNKLLEAGTHLDEAVKLARMRGRVEEEFLGLVQLARLRFRQGKLEDARDKLERMEDRFRQSYPCFYADAANVLASIERKENHRNAMAAAFTAAFNLAKCDGPPFTYRWAFETARRKLLELGVALPPLNAARGMSMNG